MLPDPVLTGNRQVEVPVGYLQRHVLWPDYLSHHSIQTNGRSAIASQGRIIINLNAGLAKQVKGRLLLVSVG